MDIKTYNLLCATNNLKPMNCLIKEDYFLEKIKGGAEEYQYYYRDILKNKEYWSEMMIWIKKFIKEPKLEKKMIKAIKQKQNDRQVNQILQDYFKPFDIFEYQLERKKKILETISKQIDIKGMRIVIYCNEVYTKLFKKIGMDVWHPGLEKGVYKICIYDDELPKLRTNKKINMREYLDPDNYYYYICNPDVQNESIKAVQHIKYFVEFNVFNFPDENKGGYSCFSLFSTEYLIKRFSGELNDNYNKLSHICKPLHQNKLELFDVEIIFKCKPNPNYISY